MATLTNLEFAPFGPYRFIGKSVYARAGAQYSGQIFGSVWGSSAWIFEALGKISEYASDEPHDVALLTGDLYEEQKKLLGYTVGRFMKPDAPIPDGMDFFDIPATHVAKGWVTGLFDDMISSAERLTSEAIKAQSEYSPDWSVTAEVYTKDTMPDGAVSSVLGYYIGCRKTEEK